MGETYQLYAANCGGSIIVEAAFALTEIPVKVHDVSWEDLGWESQALRHLNPLGQVPTVVMPDGTVLTESAAILLHLHDRCPIAGLLPAIDDPARANFLRWFVFLVAAVYPTFTYGDVPERWAGSVGRDALRMATDTHRQMLYGMLEAEARNPWFLGASLSAIDLYLWPMSHWRPGREWFAEHCPTLFAIASRLEAEPFLKTVLARNFPGAD